MDVLTNQRELQMESNRVRASCMRLTVSSSNSSWSYSEMATRNRIVVTFSKQCIHFLRSERWPPTSNMRYVRSPMMKVVSVMPVVLTRERSTSWSLGM